jgi:hypothetical protein
MTEEQKAGRRTLGFRVGDEWVAPEVEGQGARDVFSPGEELWGMCRKMNKL